MYLAPPARTRSSAAMGLPHPLVGYLLTCIIMHVLGEGLGSFDRENLHFASYYRPTAPISTQSALDNNGCASLVLSSAASAAVGNPSANPSPGTLALRAASVSSSPSASPNSRAAACGLSIRSLRLALAIWMQG